MLSKALLTAAAGMMASQQGEYIEDVFNTSLYTGNGGTQGIVNGIRLGNGVEIAPGTALGGGFFGGFISTTQNGTPTHALIVAPNAGGSTVNLAWKTSQTATANTSSSFDGAANTAAMIAAGAAQHPAAQFCDNLTIGGFTDWYLPARDELDIAYFNLKPIAGGNNTGFGTNNYAVPPRSSNYTETIPSQTLASAFKIGGSEAFVADEFYWSSTEAATELAWKFLFSSGYQETDGKASSPFRRVRAFRKIPINDPLLDVYRVTGEGGLVWFKGRNSPLDHYLFDTLRGTGNALSSNSTNFPDISAGSGVNSFNPNGFNFNNIRYGINSNAINYASWTFRKAPKFFDIVTYTGNGVSGRTVAHNLGSVPGTIIVKSTSAIDNWQVYHRSLGATQFLNLDTTSGANSNSNRWNNTQPTSSVFTLGSGASVNAAGQTYIAYLFAHDAGGFGDDGNQSVISCGSYTGNGLGDGPSVNLGWEPQWVLTKGIGPNGSNWQIIDAVRGFSTVNDAALRPNTSQEEVVADYLSPTATGFKVTTASNTVNFSGETFVYIAIRRGPMKTPTDATKVFNAVINAGGDGTFNTGFPIDLTWGVNRNSSTNTFPGIGARITGPNFLQTNSTNSEQPGGNGSPVYFNFASSFSVTTTNFWGTNFPVVTWNFRRAPGFFDVVAYNGGGTSVNHNLGVKPELAFIKVRSISNRNWIAAIQGGTGGYLNTTDPINSSNLFINLTSATSTTFPINGNPEVGQSGQTYIAYLFATCPGVSKVGTYTGNGSGQNIDCGFTNGARFVLLRRTDTLSNWIVFDAARGIVSGADPFFSPNSNEPEVIGFDVIDPISTGFSVPGVGSTNTNGGQYLFLAIA